MPIQINPEILEAVIGAAGSIVAALVLSSRTQLRFFDVFTLGLAATALYIAVSSWSESGVPPFRVVTERITAHTMDVAHTNSSYEYPKYAAPSVPAPARSHELPAVRCECGYTPIAAWHEVIGSHPTVDTMYSIGAGVADEKVTVSLRARQGKQGYSYIRIMVLCSRT